MLPSEPNKPDLASGGLPTPKPGPGQANGTLLPLEGQLGNGVGTLTLPPALSSTPNAWALLRALQRRWLLALTVGLVGAAIAVGVTCLLLPTSKYTVRSMLYVRAEAPRVLFSTQEPRSEFASYQRTQA